MGLTRAGGFALLALFIFGCAGPKVKVEQPMAFKSVSGELGRITYTLPDGTKSYRSLPWDATWKIEGGQFTTSTSAFKIQGLVGAICFSSPSGLQGSPWAGLRLIHIGPAGIDVGFDKYQFSAGGDWLIRGIIVGPSVMFPYLSTKSSGVGIKGAILF
jgi:hypothetical protein